MRLVNFLNQIGKLAAPPVLESMNLAISRGNHAAVSLDHRRDLLALVRMNNENNFVMSHAFFLMGGASRDADAVRQGLNLRQANMGCPVHLKEGMQQP